MSKRREYHVDHRAKKAALFFLACGLNPDTRVKIPNAMRIKGYSNVEAANQLLQQQVRCEVEKLKGEAIPCPPAPVAAAASLLMALLATANMGRPALRTILPNPATIVAPSAECGGRREGEREEEPSGVSREARGRTPHRRPPPEQSGR